MLINSNFNSNRNQRTNFKALPIDKITKNDRAAEVFVTEVQEGKIPKTDENVKDLFIAIEKAIKEKKFGVKSYLEELRDEIWQVKQ